jgi:hypothetical protein
MDGGQNTRRKCRLVKDFKAAGTKGSNVNQPPYCEHTAQTPSHAHSERTFARWQRSEDGSTTTGPQHTYVSRSIGMVSTKTFSFTQQFIKSAQDVNPQKLCSLIFLLGRYACVTFPDIVIEISSSCSPYDRAVGLMARSRCRTYFVEEKK